MSGSERGIDWLVDKIRKREKIEKPMVKPLFQDLEDQMPLFLHAALLDGLHDMWRLNGPKLIYRLGVLMGHKLRVELAEKMKLEDVGTWEAAVEQLPALLDLFSDRVEIVKVTRAYARIERSGCQCMKMDLAVDYCPHDTLICGIIAGFVQHTLKIDNVECKLKACGREYEEALCIHEVQMKD